MPPGELRFRVRSELRKRIDRAAVAVRRPGWRREELLRALSRETIESAAWQGAIVALRRGEYVQAHRALARHFQQRRSPFPLNAVELPHLVDAIVRNHPRATTDAREQADAIADGRYDLLGFRGLHLGHSPDWHRDPVSGRSAPPMFWASLPYLDPALGDHKITWELNRHQHWLALGRAYALTGERRFYETFTNQLAGWIAANPPLVGTNWASMLELAFRVISWLWALELFAAAAGDDDREPWLVDMLLAIDRQLLHIENNLSYYFSPNTHLSGEALALYVAGLALPELQASEHRTGVGRDVLLQEGNRQIRADGGHVELSAHYHRYSTDFYLLAAIVAARANDPAATAFEEAAARQARYLRLIADDSGSLPLIGDDDGGQLFPICRRHPADCRDTLAVAALLLKEPSLAIEPAPEEAYWLWGRTAASAAGPFDRTAWPSAALSASGYFVSRTVRGDHLVFDAGAHGFLNGGHAHADALSCVLTVAGRPLLIDPGTATYTQDAAIRDRFRGSMMHNTVVLDHRSQSIPRGPFHWQTTARALAPIWRAAGDCDYMEGTHDGYAPHRHTRAILAVHRVGWWIVDRMLGSGVVPVACYWHVHPSWQIAMHGHHLAILHSGPARHALASSAPLTLLPDGDPLSAWAPIYGHIEPAPVLVGQMIARLPATIASFIPATAEIADGLQLQPVDISADPGSGWHGTACRLRWSGGAMVLLAALEHTGIATDEMAAPARRWGTAELQSDARLALVIDRTMGRSEAVLVNGRTLDARSRPRLVSLPSRVPLSRITLSSVAPTVHEAAAAGERCV